MWPHDREDRGCSFDRIPFIPPLSHLFSLLSTKWPWLRVVYRSVVHRPGWGASIHRLCTLFQNSLYILTALVLAFRAIRAYWFPLYCTVPPSGFRNPARSPDQSAKILLNPTRPSRCGNGRICLIAMLKWFLTPWDQTVREYLTIHPECLFFFSFRMSKFRMAFSPVATRRSVLYSDFLQISPPISPN